MDKKFIQKYKILLNTMDLNFNEYLFIYVIFIKILKIIDCGSFVEVVFLI